MNSIKLNNHITDITDISDSLYDVEERIKNTGELFSSLMFIIISKKETQNLEELLISIVRNINKVNDDLKVVISIAR